MSEFLTPQAVADWAEMMDTCPNMTTTAATLREMAAIVEAVADDAEPVLVRVESSAHKWMRCPSCLLIWEPKSAEDHAPGCIGIRARKLRGLS